ncbi:YuzD family protein [Bacillus massiliglaciei]|uniref:YuzD family protein n=1 Tax=Bacillus massiliglaciei TaxID=1816693 RepID=UPI000DA60AB1|nr:YuzD family protein [Bacillus massiliglaciei]
MNNKIAEIEVYGAEVLCASCVNQPSAKDTFEWLQAALSRKYPGQPFNMIYVDIFQPPETEVLKQVAEKIIVEDLFYPLVRLNGEIVAEGTVSLKKVNEKMIELGYQPA